MTETRSLSRFASIANAAFNSMTANSTAVTSMTIGGVAMNANGVASNTFTIGTAAYFVANGNLGIGTTSPGSTLDVNGNMTVTGTARRITSDMSSANTLVRFALQTSTTNGDTGVYVLPNGTATTSGFLLFANSNPSNTSAAIVATTSTEFLFSSSRSGTGTFLPMTFAAGGSERMRITAAGNIGIGTTSPNLGFTVERDNGNGWGAWFGANTTSDRVGLGVRNSRASIQGFNSSGFGADLVLQPDSGNVGIGTGSPGARLDAVSSGSAPIRISAGAGSGYGFLQAGQSATASQNWHIGSEGDGTFRWYNGNLGAGTERMRIDSGGRVTMPNQPAFRAYGGTAFTTTGSFQTAVFTATNINNGSHYNTSNGRFTAPVAGRYFFSYNFVQMGSATGPAAYIHVNEVTQEGAAINYYDAYQSCGTSIILNLAANDYVTVRFIGFNSSFSAIDMGWSSFSGFLLG